MLHRNSRQKKIKVLTRNRHRLKKRIVRAIVVVNNAPDSKATDNVAISADDNVAGAVVNVKGEAISKKVEV